MQYLDDQIWTSLKARSCLFLFFYHHAPLAYRDKFDSCFTPGLISPTCITTLSRTAVLLRIRRLLRTKFIIISAGQTLAIIHVCKMQQIVPRT